jgi:hypothetical protein
LRRDRDILVFDPVHCYGLPGYLQIIELLEPARASGRLLLSRLLRLAAVIAAPEPEAVTARCTGSLMTRSPVLRVTRDAAVGPSIPAIELLPDDHSPRRPLREAAPVRAICI